MKVTQKKSNRNIWIISIAAVIIVAGLLLTYFVFAQSGTLTLPGQQVNDKTIDDESKEIPNTTNGTDKTKPTNTDQPPQTQTDEASGKRIIPTVVSVNIDGTTVYIRGGVNTPEAQGSCFAELTGPDGARIQKDTTILPGVSTTDCKTIIFPASELSRGEWKVTLNFSSSNAQGKSDAATVVIN